MAERLFAEMPSPGPEEYALVIDAAARQGNLTRAEHWYNHAAQAGVEFQQQNVLTNLMFAAARGGDAKAAERWMIQAREAGMDDTPTMYPGDYMNPKISSIRLSFLSQVI